MRSPRPLAAALFAAALVAGVVVLAAAPRTPAHARPPARPTADAPAGDALDTARARMVQDMASLRFDKLGNPVLRWDHIPPVRATKERPHKLLVALVAYPDRGFDRFKGAPDQGKKLAAFYQGQLFDPDYAKAGTLSHYYATQSLGLYHLQGQVLPPITLSKPRAAYGLPRRPEGGSWRNDNDPEGLVEEVLGRLAKEYPDLDWASFDRWDPHDYDGDGVLAEADGYLDHFVIIFAGGGQSSCQSLYKLSEKLNPNAGMEVLKTLDAGERECAERIWPHRFMLQKRTGQGPVVEGMVNARGGVRVLRASATHGELWGRDYNMQSEYTDVSTFTHEFGHSIGLPDIYARRTSNSTGAWELMSGTTSPLPQNLSAWSRLMLGWLKPAIILPPAFGGQPVQSTYLRTLDDPAPAQGPPGDVETDPGVRRAAMVILPPKVKRIVLAPLPKSKLRRGPNHRGLYSGQGNELNRSVELRLDLRKATAPAALSFQAWWEIEGGWDFAYVEASTDDGAHWTRLVPTDRRLMPAKHGHDGPKTLPGFTGLSGDLDGDGKNESNPRCKPKQKLAHGEDKASQAHNPCLDPTWVRPAFDLSPFAGHELVVRLRYFTDMAAVMRGILIDDVVVTAKVDGKRSTLLAEPFEGRLQAAVVPHGFTPSTGSHILLVPHYYLLEYRDPYAGPATPDASGAYRYDAALARPRTYFLADPKTGSPQAVQVRHRPGVLAWYYDGAFAWSENDPADNGQGKGYLLALDANPNELPLPGLEPWLQGDPAHFDTRYELKDPQAQTAVRDAWLKTMCFVRNRRYWPRDLATLIPGATCARDASSPAPVGRLTDNGERDGKPYLYVYELINDLLPGTAREAVRPAGELYDYRQRPGKPTRWRLRDRTLRALHNADSPFALAPFPDAVTWWRVEDGPGGAKLVKTRSFAAPATPAFDDARSARWKNPKLYFGGVSVPDEGLGFRLAKPKAAAGKSARVKVYFRWRR